MKEGIGLKIRDDIKKLTVTQSNLARALGLTPARVNQLIELEVVVRDDSDKSGGVKLFESIRNYYQSKQTSKDETDGKSLNYWNERALHTKVQRQRAELKLALEQGRLYDAATVERVMIEQLVGLRTQLLGLSVKLAPQLEMKTRAEIAFELNREIEDALSNLSEYKPELFAIEEEADDA